MAFLLHDLKNPITALILEAEIHLDDGWTGKVSPEAWSRVLNQSEHMLNLVTGWMDFLRSRQIHLTPDKAYVNLGRFMEAVLRRHQVWFDSLGLEVALWIDPLLPVVLIDPLLMERVLGNLLDNCIRFSPRGGRIAVEFLKGNDQNFKILVSDEGPGLPEEQAIHLFDPYAQFGPSSGKNGRGSVGLGLAFCKMAVEAHGGHIGSAQGPTTGACFWIELPLGGSASPAGPCAPADGSPAPRDGRIPEHHQG